MGLSKKYFLMKNPALIMGISHFQDGVVLRDMKGDRSAFHISKNIKRNEWIWALRRPNPLIPF
jgi:hypothetical protein